MPDVRYTQPDVCARIGKGHGVATGFNPDALSGLIQGTAVERARGERLIRNLIVAAGNSGDPNLADTLEPYAVTASSGLAEQVGWALKRLRG